MRPRRGSQDFDQALVLGTISGLRVEELHQEADQARVDALALQAGVIEELPKGLEGRIFILQPQHQKLFQGNLAIGYQAAIRTARDA